MESPSAWQYYFAMALTWSDDELVAIERAMKSHPIESGRCAALARRVFELAERTDSSTHGLQVLPKTPARFVVPKLPHPPLWYSHTLVSTRHHRVDALTRAPGCEEASYLERHWEYPEALRVDRVDVYEIDPGIEVDDG